MSRRNGRRSNEEELEEEVEEAEAEEEKEAEDEGEWWGKCSLLPPYISGGGTATLKVRGDVVVAGTRRVFVSAADGRKRRLLSTFSQRCARRDKDRRRATEVGSSEDRSERRGR